MRIDDVLDRTQKNLTTLGYHGIALDIEFDEPGAFFGIDDPLQIEPHSDRAVLRVRNITSYPDDALERIIEHRCAWLAQYITQGFTPVSSAPQYLIAALQERIRDAYLEYAAGTRMIAAFGQERYDAYQQTSAPGLCDLVDERVRKALLPEERFELITFFLREYTKDLLATNKPNAPPVITQLLPAAENVFAYVQGLPTPNREDFRARADAGLRRSKLLSLLGTHLLEHVDVVDSYDKKTIVFFPGGESSMLDSFRPALDSVTRVSAKHVEGLIVGAYGLAGHESLVSDDLN